MSYIQDNLVKDETVIYQAKVHPLIFIFPALLILLGVICFIVADKTPNVVTVSLGIALPIYGLAKLITSIIAFFTTELAITNKRVIAKAGFIGRDTIELNHNKVEGFQVRQPVFGRLLGYGTILVRGTGGSKTGIPNIASPMTFRKKAAEVIDSAQS